MNALEQLQITQSDPMFSFATLANDFFNVDANTGHLKESFASLKDIKIEVSFADTRKALIAPFLKDGSIFTNYRSPFAIASITNIFSAMEPRTTITINVSQLDIIRQNDHTVNLYDPLSHLQIFFAKIGIKVTHSGD